MQVKDRRGPKPGAHLFLLLLAIAGGLVLNLFSTLSVNRASAQGEQPADQIAFARDGQIFIINPDGTGLTPVGTGSSPAWSNQGKIAFTESAGDALSNIGVMDEDGTNRVTLTRSAGTGIGEPDFSPNGTKIAFVAPVLQTDAGEPAPLAHARIHVMGADGQNLRRLFAGDVSSGVEHEYAPAWSPDGTKVAFIGQRNAGGLTSMDVYVASADGLSAPVRVTDNLNLNITFPSQLAWSPDGLRLAIAANHDIQVINADGSGGLVNLTGTVLDDEFDPAWSPDGQKIVYSANRYQDSGHNGIYVMDADGQHQTFLGTTGFEPTWKKRSVTPEADIAVELKAAPLSVEVGQNLTYTLTVTNNGPATAENVEANLIRSVSLQLVSATPAQGSCGPDGNPLRCQLGQLTSGAQTSIQFVVKATVAEQVVAFAGASSQTLDRDPSNDSKQLTLKVVEPCAAEVTGEVQQFISRQGNQSRRNLKQSIYVRNDSGRVLNGLVHFVFDGLPESVQSDNPGVSFSRTRCAQPLGRRYTSVNLGSLNWQPGQTIRLDMDFFNPERLPVQYSLRIYTGPALP